MRPPAAWSGHQKGFPGKGIEHDVVTLFVAHIDLGDMAGVRTQNDARLSFDFGRVRQSAWTRGASGEHEEEQAARHNQLHAGEVGAVAIGGQAAEALPSIAQTKRPPL